jgi:hypothetical protein
MRKSTAMDYFDDSLPGIDVPRYAGDRYQAVVPDTLELADVASLTIRAITNMLDPSRDYLMYARARFDRRPPAIRFLHANDGASGPKHLEGLPLLRIVSGSTYNIEVDKGYAESYLHMTGKDGCVYWPLKMFLNPNTPPMCPEPYGSVENEGRHILALCMWHQHDRNPLWKTLIEKKIQRLTELAILEDDYAYFTNRPYQAPRVTSEVTFTPTDTADTVRDPSGGRGRFEEPTLNAHLVNFMLSRSLCVYYRLTGYEPALDLAGRIVRGALEQTKGFEDDGRWLLYHFHISAASLLAFLEYAIATEDRALMAFVGRAYEYAKVLGDPLVGFFPELVPGSDRYLSRRVNTSEICEVADMIGLALKLSLAGVGDCWADVERWVRNQFAEGQLTDDKLRTVLANLESKGLYEEQPIYYWESAEIERAVGGFAGWATPNDYGVGSMYACCTGNASRTIYWIWDSILTKEDGAVRVNLLMNRASPWLNLDSYLPYQGKVVLKIKDARQVAVRIPEWTERERVACTVNGEGRGFGWSGDYVQVGGLKAGDTVALEFPMVTRTLFRIIGGRFPYKLTIKGNTVVGIDPEGELCPLYQRGHYLGDEAPLREITRFVSSESIMW